MWILALGLSAGLAFLTSLFSSPYMGLASFAFFAMTSGLFLLKKSPKQHAGLMSTAMLVDLTLVLVLELTRGAVMATVTNDYGLWNYLHFASSTVAVFLYPLTFYFGFKRLKGQASPGQKVRHKQLAVLTYFFRTVGFFTMFSLLENISLH